MYVVLLYRTNDGLSVGIDCVIVLVKIKHIAGDGRKIHSSWSNVEFTFSLKVKMKIL